MATATTTSRTLPAAALALLALASLAGCAEGEGQPRGFQAVLLTGNVRGEGGAQSVDESCDAALAFRVDYVSRRVSYANGTVELSPARTEAVVFLDGSFEHSEQMPCFPFKGLAPQGQGFHAAVLEVAPFRLEVPFTLAEEGTIEAGGQRLPPGASLDLPVDQVDGGIHYTGLVRLHNLGPWSFEGVRVVASPDEL